MPALDSSLSIGRMSLRNRLVLPPISTNFADEEGLVTEESLSFYQQRSRHVGLTIVEAAAIRADGRITNRSTGIWNDDQLPGLSTLAATIKVEGAMASIQINHAGARSVPIEGGVRGASPSGFQFRPDVDPTVITEELIAEFTEDFARAAERAARAGFDCVEIHGAHFYLLSQFLSPLTNSRTDRYGGDAGGRAAFPLEVVKAIRQRVGSEYPLLFRLNGVEKAEGGQTLDDAVAISHLLKQAGVDALHVSAIPQSSWQEIEGRRFIKTSSCLTKEQPGGSNTPYATRIKAEVGIPVITVGKLGKPGVAREIVESGQADAVALGRQMIADPDAAAKVLAGHETKIVECKECMGCMTLLVSNRPIRCSANHNLVGPAEYTRSR